MYTTGEGIVAVRHHTPKSWGEQINPKEYADRMAEGQRDITMGESSSVNRTQVAELMCLKVADLVRHHTPKSWDERFNPREYVDRMTTYQEDLLYATSESIVTAWARLLASWPSRPCTHSRCPSSFSESGSWGFPRWAARPV